MTDQNIQDGAPIASALPPTSRNHLPIARTVETLADLLTAIGNNPPSYFQMLRSTVARIVSFQLRPADQITLDAIYVSREGFRPFLEKNKYKENSIRAYVNYLRILLEAAEALGWKPLARISEQWQDVLNRASHVGCFGIAKWLSQKKTNPSDVTPADTDCWLALKIQQGTTYRTAKSRVNKLWRILADRGYNKNAPAVYLNREKYGISLYAFPTMLRSEVTELLRWKCSEYEPDRPKRAKIRKVSALRLQHSFSTLYGYVVNIRKTPGIASLAALLQRHLVSDYVTWSLNERKKQGASFVTQIAAIQAAVSNHPAYKSLDWTWLKQIQEGIPCDSIEEVKKRKAQKYLDYSVVDKIPEKIRAIRGQNSKTSKLAAALLVLEELLIKWLLILPWRQRNIRECRIGGPNPNLFKGKIPPFSLIDKPGWATEEEARNPDAEFWQFRFSKEETKTGVFVHALVPRPLIGRLQEYLTEYRPSILNGGECDTLFVSSVGTPMSAEYVGSLISDITLRYGGRRVTPHLFRDIVAFAWLKAHPKDYLTLSKMLWHKNVSTTINYYGSRFNEASGCVAMETWIEEREARTNGLR
ncbi:hypothetical protein P8935_12215 [Telmatobacter sp. DSM 110680]|uniref:Tyr recombinase domain-containing protein n=1 Tax=Telmatobacter sp. DSM 110680 TaxID=3036704 RepID=A0AAU7DSP9_9BACT